MEFKDYYETLGVSKNASAEEVKQAYRRLVRKHHPDLHPERDKAAQTEIIKAINEAYSVLGDPENRAKYDRLGERWREGEPPPEPPRRGDGGGAFRARDATGAEAFSEFFSRFFGSGGGEEWEAPSPLVDIEAELALPLEDAVHGTERVFSLDASGLCLDCRGTGRRDGRFCPSCGGAGESIRRRQVRARLPPGLHDGSRIRLKGQGSETRGRKGDLFLTIRLAPDPRFEVLGSDLETRVRIMPWDAALGGEAAVPTLEGPVRVRVPPDTRAGKRLRLAGRGLGRPGGGRGDLFARVEIDLPETLSPRARELLAKLRDEAHASPRSR